VAPLLVGWITASIEEPRASCWTYATITRTCRNVQPSRSFPT